MRDVAGEAALVLLARLDGIGHAVEGAAELRDLVPARGRDPPPEIALAQPLRRERHGTDGAQHGPAQEQAAEDDGEGHPRRDGHGGGGGQGGRRVVPNAEADLQARRGGGTDPRVEHPLQTRGEARLCLARPDRFEILRSRRIGISARALALRGPALRGHPGDAEAVRQGHHLRPGTRQAGGIGRGRTVVGDRTGGLLHRDTLHLPLGEPQVRARVDQDGGLTAQRTGRGRRGRRSRRAGHRTPWRPGCAGRSPSRARPPSARFRPTYRARNRRP